MPKALHRRESKATAEESLEHYLRETPAAPALLRRPRRVSPARFDADYSYLARAMAGDRGSRWATRARSSTRSSRPGCCSPCRAGSRPAEAIDAGLRAGDLSARRFERLRAGGAAALHYFRRFVVGFYDPYFRRLLFRRSRRLGIYEAVLSALAGNWRPTLGTRLRIQLFFAIVAMKRVFRMAPPDDATWRP